MKYSIIELLKLIKQRPWIYIWTNRNVKSVIIFISWYSFWIWNDNELLKDEQFNKFQDYLIDKTIWMDNRNNDCWKYWDCLLKVSSYNEEKAFDLFFELLDKFIEENNIEINIKK